MLPGLRFTRRPLFPLGIKTVIYGLFVGTLSEKMAMQIFSPSETACSLYLNLLISMAATGYYRAAQHYEPETSATV